MNIVNLKQSNVTNSFEKSIDFALAFIFKKKILQNICALVFIVKHVDPDQRASTRFPWSPLMGLLQQMGSLHRL